MLRIAWSTLRFRTTAFVAGFLAMLVGAAIVMACGGLMESGIRAEVPAERLAAADVVVTGDQSYASESSAEWARLPAAAADRIKSVDGVAGLAGDVSFPAVALRAGRPVSTGSSGHDWASAALTPYRLTAGAPPAAAGDVVLDAAVARAAGAGIGGRIDLAVGGRTESVNVRGIATAAGDPAPSIFFMARDVERLAPHHGEFDSVGVFAAPGVDTGELADRIETALAGLPITILTGDQRGIAEHPEALAGANRMRIMAGVFSGWTALVTVFGVASMIALSVQQRRREIALLRAIGTTPRQIRQMVLGETLILAVLATGLAYLPGRYLGRLLFDRLTEGGVATPLLQFRLGWIPSLIGIAAALGAAVAAALIAGRRAARTPAVQAIAEASVQTRWFSKARLGFALFFLLGGISQGVVTVLVMTGPLTSATAGPASVFVAIGLALLSPGIAKAAVRVLGAPLRAIGISGELATEHVRSHAIRFASAVTPVILLTGIAIGTLYLQETEDSSNQRVFRDNLSADAVVTSVTGGFRPEVATMIRALPGVAGASEFVTGSAELESPADHSQVGGWKTQGITGSDGAATTTLRPSAGSLAALTGKTAAIPELTAQAHGLGIGDAITVRFGDNTAESLRVVAIYPVQKGNERIVLPSDLLAAHTTPGLPTQILVRAAAGVDPAALATAITRASSGVPGLVVTDRETLNAAQSNLQRMLASANYAVVALLVGFSVLSVINSLVSATAGRRREFGLLRLSGATRAQVLRSAGVEGLLVAVLGSVLGSIASVATLVPFALVKNDSPIPSGPVWIYLVVLGSVVVITIAAILTPAWRVLRVRPVEAALRAE
jgi:putative ABC transport system permease protein